MDYMPLYIALHVDEGQAYVTVSALLCNTHSNPQGSLKAC